MRRCLLTKLKTRMLALLKLGNSAKVTDNYILNLNNNKHVPNSVGCIRRSYAGSLPLFRLIHQQLISRCPPDDLRGPALASLEGSHNSAPYETFTPAKAKGTSPEERHDSDGDSVYSTFAGAVGHSPRVPRKVFRNQDAGGG